MKNELSVVIAAKNDDDVLEKTLKSLYWVDELIIVLAKDSTDNTEAISKRFTSKAYKYDNHLGKQRLFGINKSSSEWILILDTDEIIPLDLATEIKNTIQSKKHNGYYIRYKTFFLNHELTNKGQRYEKRRLFRRKLGTVEKLKVHPEITIEGSVGTTINKINHYSYRSIPQTLRKFTYYAQQEAPGRFQKGERATLKKFTLYPAHMFWAIFVEDEGYIDGIWGFGLALCFTYYEFMRYVFLWIYQRKKI